MIEFTAIERDAIIQVGAGRGFVVAREPWPSDIITAAHCLPFVPPALLRSDVHERTYHALIGPRGGPTMIMAECRFVDPIADVAILCCPDDQAYVEAEAYEAFMADRPTIPIGPVDDRCDAWLLTLDDQWERCTIRPGVRGYTITIIDATHGHAGGTSGSPILTASGHAVGLVSMGSETSRDRDGPHTIDSEQPGQPMLVRALPAGWLADYHARRP